MLTPASSTLGAPTTSQGAEVRPVLSNSSASGRWFLEDSCVVFERDRETMLTTNSPVYSTLLKVYFSASLSAGGTDADVEHRRVAVGSERRKPQRDRVLGPPHSRRRQV